MDMLDNPLFRDSLIVLLTLWPAVRILRRLGLNPFAAFLLLLSVIIPLLGHALLALCVVSSKWPALPPLPEKPKRRRTA